MFLEPVTSIEDTVMSQDISGCGIAVLAMVLGVDYAWMKSRYPDLAKRGMHFEMMRSLLTVHTNREIVDGDYYNTGLPSEFPLVVLVDMPATSHWVAYHGKQVFDPEYAAPYELGAHGHRKVLGVLRIEGKLAEDLYTMHNVLRDY